jgi:hypothetical protein
LSGLLGSALSFLGFCLGALFPTFQWVVSDSVFQLQPLLVERKGTVWLAAAYSGAGCSLQLGLARCLFAQLAFSQVGNPLCS